MFVVYALYSKIHDKIYIGFTGDLIERFKSHNEIAKKGWTIKFRPWEIIYQEHCGSKTEAMHREKQHKTAAGRNFIRSLTNAKV